MSSHFPIVLRGKNLGERHRYLNYLVSDAHFVGDSFETIIMLPESSPVDRLFKIDFALKYKQVDYILKNLREDKMLYVSRALKSKWLLDDEYRNIINPENLENVLYPEMITTAVNKMKHWIHLNLQDSARCQEFYEYYYDKDAHLAFKFLCKSPKELILNEFPKEHNLALITPHYLKILCEKAPSIATMFFEVLKKDESLFNKFRAKDYKYFGSLKCILKSDSDLYLDIVEKYFAPQFQRLSPNATKFIMTQRKDRFLRKSELYTARILNMGTLAECLSPEECEELIIKLARAKYLGQWFNYKNVEPLIKRLDIRKRALVKKEVFVDKDIGDVVKEWPYAVPVSFIEEYSKFYTDEVDVFQDNEESPREYEYLVHDSIRHRFCKMSSPLHMPCCSAYYECAADCIIKKSYLDCLFDEYRFKNFDQTLFELRKKITSESSSQNRMNMFLVLVSKSGGRSESLEVLLRLLLEHRNEPPQIRAAVVRSLVKRAFIWRVPDNIWKDLLTFGQDLGLDGNPPQADCDEGLHAVVIRSLLKNGDCDSTIKESFIKKFSTLTSYSLTTTEKRCICKLLLNILIEKALSENKPNLAAQIIQFTLDTLQAYNIKFEKCHGATTVIKNLVTKDPAAADTILKRLFVSKLGRKELFREIFNVIQTDASYLNVLKHDISVLSGDKFVKSILTSKLKAEQFLRKMSVYFCEKYGLAFRFLTAIEEAKIDQKLARPFVYLFSDDLESYTLNLDTGHADMRRFSSAIRANAHLAKLPISLDSLEWHKAGVKLIANRILKCRTVEIDRFIEQLLTWKRTARLAISLAQRTNYEAKVYAAVAKIRPTATLKTALAYFRRQGERSDLQVWEITKPLIVNAGGSLKKSHHLLCNIKRVGTIPICIRAEYATLVCIVINDIDLDLSLSVLCHINILLPKVDDDFVASVLFDFLQNQFILEKMYKDFDRYKVASLFLRILGKYLLLCKSEEAQTRKLKKVAQLYFYRLESYWKSTQKKSLFLKYIDEISYALKYTEAFLNEEYVSCVPVIEFFLQWMQKILPMEKYFKYYVPLHITMLYFKAIRLTVKQFPDVFTDKQRRNDGIKLVGEAFGKYIGHEAQVLNEKYFDSIIDLYGQSLVKYIHKYFNRGIVRMVPHIIKGILTVTNGVQSTLALHIYNEYKFTIAATEKEEIRKCLRQKDDIVIHFFFTDFIIGE